MPEAVSQQREVKGELFRLTAALASARTDAYCENLAIRYSFADIWYYQVPVGQEFIITPEHHVSVYIEDDETSPAAWGDPQKVRVVVWDADKTRMQVIYQGLYVESKEMQDIEKMATFDLLKEPLLVKAGDWIQIEGKCDNGTTALYTIDVSDSYFSLEMFRVRPGLFT